MDDGLDIKKYRPILVLSILSPFALFAIGFALLGFVEFTFQLHLFGELDLPKGVQIATGILAGALALFSGWQWIGVLRGQKIVIKQTEVYAPQNNWLKRESYQLEVHIPYTEIADISVKVTTKTSENKSVWYLWHPKVWAIFKMKDETTKRLCIDMFTGKTKARILDDIIERCIMVGNKLDIPCGKDLLVKKRKKKKNM